MDVELGHFLQLQFELTPNPECDVDSVRVDIM